MAVLTPHVAARIASAPETLVSVRRSIIGMRIGLARSSSFAIQPVLHPWHMRRVTSVATSGFWNSRTWTPALLIRHVAGPLSFASYPNTSFSHSGKTCSREPAAEPQNMQVRAVVRLSFVVTVGE